jgi:hypothetical protein
MEMSLQVARQLPGRCHQFRLCPMMHILTPELCLPECGVTILLKNYLYYIYTLYIYIYNKYNLDLDLFISIIWYYMYGTGWSMDLPCWKSSADTLQDEAKIPREILKANAPLRNHHFLTGISHENHLQQGCCQHLKYERVNLCRLGKWSGKRTNKPPLWLWYTCSCLEQPCTSGSAVTETVESHPDSALESKHDPWIETDDTFQVLRVCFNISQPGSRNDCVRWHPQYLQNPMDIQGIPNSTMQCIPYTVHCAQL